MNFVLSFHIEWDYHSLTMLKNKMNFMLRFLLNLSIAPLPAKELNELIYAAFHT